MGAIGARIGGAQGLRGLAAGALTGVAADIAGAATRTLLTGTDFGDNLIAELPNTVAVTIGNWVAGGIQARGQAAAAGMAKSQPSNSSGDSSGYYVRADGSIDRNRYIVAPEGETYVGGSSGASTDNDVTILPDIIVIGKRHNTFDDLIHGHWSFLMGDIRRDARNFFSSPMLSQGDGSYYALPAPQVSQQTYQSIERQKVLARARALDSAQSPQMLALAGGTLAAVAVPFIVADGVPTALMAGGRSLFTRDALIKVGTSGGVGAIVNGGFTLTTGGSLQESAGQAGNGFITGVATSTVGILTGGISKPVRAIAEGGTAYTATRLTGGSEFQAVVAGGVSGGMTFYDASDLSRNVATGIARRTIATLEKHAGEAAQAIEKKILSTGVKKSIDSFEQKEEDKK